MLHPCAQTTEARACVRFAYARRPRVLGPPRRRGAQCILSLRRLLTFQLQIVSHRSVVIAPSRALPMRHPSRSEVTARRIVDTLIQGRQWLYLASLLSSSCAALLWGLSGHESSYKQCIISIWDSRRRSSLIIHNLLLHLISLPLSLASWDPGQNRSFCLSSCPRTCRSLASLTGLGRPIKGR